MGGGSKEELEASYLSGLMHDVGILVFDYLIPDEYEAFLKNNADAEKGLEELELDAFGISHPELGARFVEKWWPVSKQVVSSIRRHHGPLSVSTTSSGISRYINCANQIANNNQIQNGVSSYICPLSPNLLKILNLSDSELGAFVASTQEGVAEAESILMG